MESITFESLWEGEVIGMYYNDPGVLWQKGTTELSFTLTQRLGRSSDNNKEIAFASKALTPVETRCGNIERQLLTVVYGCEKFHSYLCGRSFVVKTNHCPLEDIHKKNLMQAPPRIQILRLRLEQALRLRQ